MVSEGPGVAQTTVIGDGVSAAYESIGSSLAFSFWRFGFAQLRGTQWAVEYAGGSES